MITQKNMELIISQLLLFGIFLSAALVLVGGVWFLIENGNQVMTTLPPPDLSHFTLSEIWSFAFSFSSLGLIQLGLLSLISIQIIRVAFLCGYYAILRDYRFTIISTFILGVLIYSVLWRDAEAATQTTAPVSGFARSFILNSIISDATITILETGQKIKTDKNGHFGPIQYPVGKPITLVLEKWEYKTTQSATMIVPPGGLTEPLNNITFQVPSIESYYLLSTLVGAKIDDNSCHVAATITAFQKTLDDCPQGEANATVVLSPAVNEIPFYFDIFKSGPLAGKTNPFTRSLTQTSEDGGVLFFNLPPRDEPYIITAQKSGSFFSKSMFICRKGVFINISPPLGPMADGVKSRQ